MSLRDSTRLLKAANNRLAVTLVCSVETHEEIKNNPVHWERQEFIGIQDMGTHKLCLKNCIECHSTMAKEVR